MLIGFIFHTPELRMNRLLHRRLPPFGKQEGVKEKGKKSKKVKRPHSNWTVISAFYLFTFLPFYLLNITLLPFKYYPFTFKYYFFSCNFFALISASR